MNEPGDLRPEDPRPGDPQHGDLRPDALWDPRVDDAEVRALERALAPRRWRELPFAASGSSPLPAPAAPLRRWRPWATVLAALLLLAVAIAWLATGTSPELLRAGAASRKFVATASPLAVPLGELAEVTLRPGSLLEFVHWRADEARFVLHRGAIDVRVAPPPVVAPGFFTVDTPLGRVVDQGCRYRLELRDDGREYVVVTEGAVTFARGERSVFVPSDAAVDLGPAGPRTPCFVDADPDLRNIVRLVDELRERGEGRERRREVLQKMLAFVGAPRDTLVLWHLLRDDDPEFAALAEARLIELVGTPFPTKEPTPTFDAEQWLAFLRVGAWRRPGK